MMTEWVLILTMHIMGAQGELRDVQMDVIDGFVSKASCEQSGKVISGQLISQTGRHRKQQKVKKNGATDFPSVFSKCTKIVK